MYYDIGNHWKYGQPGEWIRQLGRRCVKLDVKGFSRAKTSWTEITEGDLPWDQVRKLLTTSASPAGRPPKWAAAT